MNEDIPGVGKFGCAALFAEVPQGHFGKETSHVTCGTSKVT